MKQMFVGVASAFLGMVLVIVLLVLVSDEPGNQEIYDRQSQMLTQLNYVSCLLLVEPGERVPEVVAGCLQASTTE